MPISNYLLPLLPRLKNCFQTIFWPPDPNAFHFFHCQFGTQLCRGRLRAHYRPVCCRCKSNPVCRAYFGISFRDHCGHFNRYFLSDAEYTYFLFKILSVFAVVQLSDNLVLQPMIFSKTVKAHPLEIFVVIFAGAKIAGITGMIFAIPVYTIFRVSVMEFFRGYKSYRIFKIKATN